MNDQVKRYGERLLTTVVDELAVEEPYKIFASVPKTLTVEDGFQDVTYQQLAKAINRAAWWLKTNIDKRHEFETIGYTGPNDLRYCFFTLGAVKAGFKLLLTASRNSVEGNVALIQSTDCAVFLTPENVPELIRKCQQLVTLSTHVIPDMDFFFKDEATESYPYSKSFDEAKQEPFIVLHTSGSTGLPKAITIKHGGLACIDALRNIPRDADLVHHRFLYEYESFFVAMPAFHAAGIFMICAMPAFSGAKVILDTPTSPMTAQHVNLVHVLAKPDASLLAPSLWDQLTENQTYLDNLRSLKGALYGGGPLSPNVGTILRKFTRIMNMYGSTEAMLLPMLIPDQTDFNHFRFYPQYGIDMRRNNDNLYELVIVKEESAIAIQGIFTTFPDLREYSMKDLFSKHPSIPGLWKYEARSDDVIVLANGEKLNPITLEQTVNSNPLVRNALVIGQGRFQTALLIESNSPDAIDHTSIVDMLWPTISAANKVNPKHGRIARNMLIFTKPQKPMLRAGKGTVQRQLTLQLYAEEIDDLYNAAETQDVIDIPLGHISDVEGMLMQIVSEAVENQPLTANSDLIAHGMDSLAALTILRHLKASFEKRNKSSDLITISTIYSAPTIHKLAQVVEHLFENGTLPELEAPGSGAIAEMQAILDKYSEPKKTVILTGSTGSLGSYILHRLIESASVEHIYCLNRSLDAERKQTEAHTSRGLSTDFDRVSFIPFKAGATQFGISDAKVYQKLLHTVTHIIHNAWPVDFNTPLSSFEPHIAGVRDLAHFAAQSTYRARLFFVSSISSAMNLVTAGLKVPEEILNGFNAPQAMGYAQSKYLSERLIALFAQRLGLDCTICRVGQIAGPVTKSQGSWNKVEWLPTLIDSSIKLGMIPDTLGAMGREGEGIDWLPVDKLSDVITELALNTNASPDITKVYHAVNPRGANWTDLLPAIEQYLQKNGGRSLKKVAYKDWVDELATRAKTSDVRRVSGFRLLDFYQSLVGNEPGDRRRDSGVFSDEERVHESPFELRKSLEASKTLAGLEAVSPAWMEMWMQQWQF
ncbi:hypothetical protein H2198_000313 [Neophaeococcomyces mojaviensis]|uniref:Uncharacterized protein n=1 Tax=Neophaeococcomyces mojaviensis TaxID=3383035 RepID=A0ACC3AKB6_9EURO|nr:hypothetical protein H2198_000313 [Knufia sp. JES_112]